MWTLKSRLEQVIEEILAGQSSDSPRMSSKALLRTVKGRFQVREDKRHPLFIRLIDPGYEWFGRGLYIYPTPTLEEVRKVRRRVEKRLGIAYRERRSAPATVIDPASHRALPST